MATPQVSNLLLQSGGWGGCLWLSGEIVDLMDHVTWYHCISDCSRPGVISIFPIIA